MANVQEPEELMDSLLKLRDLSRAVKVDLRITCKLGMFLVMAMEQSLASTDPGNLLRRVVSEDDRAKLQDLADEILQKAEAEDFYGLIKKIAKR